MGTSRSGGQAGGRVTAARTVGLTGHRSAGKTQLAEMLLAAGGVVREAGRVDAGDTLLDTTPEERARHMSLWPGFAWIPWGDAVVELVDTPGTGACAWPAELARLGTDLGLLVISAPDGLERGALAALREAVNDDRPWMVVINKMDRARDTAGLVEAIGAAARRKAVPLQLPWQEGGRFVGVIDLIGWRSLRLEAGALVPGEIPAGLVNPARAAREAMLEAAALGDEAILEQYLEMLDLGVEDTWRGLRAAMEAGHIVGVLYASALEGVGGGPILDAIVRLGPEPTAWQVPADASGRPQFVAQWLATLLDEDGAPYSVHRVWHGVIPANPAWTNVRTGESGKVRKLYRVRGPRRALAQHPGAGSLVAVWDELPGLAGDTFTDGPRLTMAIPRPRPPMAWLWLRMDRAHEEEKLLVALAALRRIDPSLSWSDEAPYDGLRLAGRSPAQLQLAVDRLRERFGLAVRAEPALVRYRERPARSIEGVMGVHLKQSGGDVAEYGECVLSIAPVAPELGFVWRCDVDEEDLPRRFHAAIAEGARRGLARGPVAGFPVIGVSARCTAGEYDALESTEAHFELAGERAMAAALERAGTEVVEPWSDVRVEAPSEHVGALLADLSAHRARVVGLSVEEERTVVEAQSPDRELRTLASRLEAIDAGRCWFVAHSSHHERLPADLLPEVLAGGAARAARGRLNPGEPR